jgi:hypothetical protein
VKKKAECEQAIRALCHQWASEQSNADLVHPNFSKFTSWLDGRKYSHYLNFKSRMGPLYDAEMWFDAELKETRRRATVADMAEILDQLTAAASPATRGSVSLRDIIMGLERHAITNDERDALRKLKEAGPDPDAPLLGYVRTVFAKRCIGVDGWPMK